MLFAIIMLYAFACLAFAALPPPPGINAIPPQGLTAPPGGIPPPSASIPPPAHADTPPETILPASQTEIPTETYSSSSIVDGFIGYAILSCQ